MDIRVYIYLVIATLIISIIDLKTRKISNYWSILHLFLFFVFTAVFSEYDAFALKTYLFPITLLICGFVLFALGVMGGGDAKFLTTMFLLIPATFHQQFLYYLLEGTMIIALFPLSYSMIKHRQKIINGILMKDFRMVFEQFKSKFPYAPVFLLASLRFGWENHLLQNIF